MFGFTEHEMEVYQDAVQAFAVQEVATEIVQSSKFVAPATQKEGKIVVSDGFVQGVLNDIETIITLTATAMAYEYAYLQDDAESVEEEIVKHLHKKYEGYVISQFIKYGISFTEDVLPEIVGDLVLEMPYLYAGARVSESFDDELFLEERLEAYNEYLDSNFYEFEGIDDFEDEDFDEEDFDEEEETELSEEDFDD